MKLLTKFSESFSFLNIGKLLSVITIDSDNLKKC